MILSKTVESGDPIGKRYDWTCVKESECGTEIKLKDGMVAIMCSSVRLMTAATAVVGSVLMAM